MRMLPSRPILPRGKAEDPEAILRSAADIVELPGAWRQGALAEDDLGVECSATEVRTARVCTHGALHRATREGYEEQTARARRRVERLLARRGGRRGRLQAGRHHELERQARPDGGGDRRGTASSRAGA